MLRTCIILLLTLVMQDALWAQAGKKRLVTASDYYKAAEEAREQGLDAKAVTYYNECLRQRVTYYEAYRGRAASYEALDKPDKALRDYTLYLDRVADDPSEVVFSRATLHYRLAHYNRAHEDFTRLLHLPPGETNTLFFRQDTFIAGADKFFTLQGSDKTIFYDYLGQIEIAMARYPSAIAYLDTAIQKNPNDVNLFIHRGLARELSEDLSGAVDDYKAALALDPSHSLAQYNLAQAEGKKGGSILAKDFINKAIQSNPKLPYPYIQRAQFNMNKGDLKAALADYDSAIKFNPDEVNYLLNRGLLKEKMKNVKGANADYTMAIEKKENFDKAWFLRANLCATLGKLPEAIDDYTIAIFHNENYREAYYQRALAYELLKKNGEACVDLAKAESLGMTIDPALKDLCK